LQKRAEETVASFRADMENKMASRQTLLDELDAQAAEKRASKNAPATSDLPAKGAAMPQDEDIVMNDLDAEGENLSISTPAGTTPAIGTPAVYEDDDLFGDEEESVMGMDAEGDAGTPRSAYVGGEVDEDTGDHDDDEENEMARMLRESMGGGGDDDMGDTGGIEDGMASPMSLSGMVLASSPAPGQGESDEMAAAALADFADAEGLDEAGDELASMMMRELEMSMAGGNANAFGVEGGVGMRRLASGIAGVEDDDESSDDSDD
jgi:transcription initiation factor TFIID subunit 7